MQRPRPVRGGWQGLDYVCCLSPTPTPSFFSSFLPNLFIFHSNTDVLPEYFIEIQHFHDITNMTTPLLNNPCTGRHEIYDFSTLVIITIYTGWMIYAWEQRRRFLIGKESAVATKCLFSSFIDRQRAWRRKLIINFNDFDNERKSEQAHIPHALSLLQNAAHNAYNHYHFGQISKFKKGVIPR